MFRRNENKRNEKHGYEKHGYREEGDYGSQRQSQNREMDEYRGDREWNRSDSRPSSGNIFTNGPSFGPDEDLAREETSGRDWHHDDSSPRWTSKRAWDESNARDWGRNESGKSYAENVGFGARDVGTGQSRGPGRSGGGYRGSTPLTEGTGTRLGRHFGKGPKNYRRSDERIQEEVCECLWRHHEIDATEIDVSVENGIVTLTGTVEDRQTRREVEIAIEDLAGVLDVRNQLTVSSAHSGGIDTTLGTGFKSERKNEAARHESKSKPASGKPSTDIM